MAIIVQKFGGTSVANISRIKAVAHIIAKEHKKNNNIVAVVSAMAGVTNSLISQCLEISNSNSAVAAREYDAAIASGEIVTAALLATELENHNIKAISLQGWQAGILTDDNHKNAQIKTIDTKIIHNYLSQNIVPVITGFQGACEAGHVTTIGKGGSDTSAAVIAGKIGADRCDIYTDVEGVYSADPRVVPAAKKLAKIEIEQLCALCEAGAKVLHPRAAYAAKKYNFDLRVLSSFKDTPGTVTFNAEPLNNNENNALTAISSDKNLCKFTIILDSANSEIIAETFHGLAERKKLKNNILELVVNFTDRCKAQKILAAELKSHKKIKSFSEDTNISSISLVGYDMIDNIELINNAVKIMQDNQVKFSMIKKNKHLFSFIVEDNKCDKIVKLLHKNLM